MREKGQTEVAKTLETPVFSRGIEILTEKVELLRETVQEITVGPLIEQDLAVKNLREFLEQRGYSDVDIKVSEIPIRY